jgi:hypothetical protein
MGMLDRFLKHHHRLHALLYAATGAFSIFSPQPPPKHSTEYTIDRKQLASDIAESHQREAG